MSFGMTMFLVCIGGRKQRRFTGILFDKMTIESPLLPSPLSCFNIGIIPNFSTKKVNYLTETRSVEK
jgi:hypothetical protein